MMMGYFLIILITTSLPLWCDSVIVDSVFTNQTQNEIDFTISVNNQETRQAAGLIKFEGETNFDYEHQNYGFSDVENKPNDVIKFDENPTEIEHFEIGSSRPLKFEDSSTSFIKFENEDTKVFKQYEPNTVTFQDENSVDQKPVQKKKKRRRRRKPRQQIPPGNLGYPGQGLHDQGFQLVPQNTGGQYSGQGYGFPQNPNIYGNPGYAQGQYRPPRRPRRPSSPDALSSIVSAFSSIARYDDAQCVPRLLCEAAGGALAGGLPQAVTGLQPLLTLLSAYNGVSTSPLFVFGRAVFLGMASKGNAATCRYAYNACPTDPEQLVHYLNNHNGGFFRFFNSPQVQQNQQNLEQFYNQLSGSYGFQQPDVGQQNYGYYNPANQGSYYGTDQAPNQGPSYGLVQSQQNYGLYQQTVQQNSGQYSQNYGSNYPYSQNQYGLAQNFRNGYEKEIQNRIQNIPTRGLPEASIDVSNSFKWSFPGSNDNYINNVQESVFKFPEQSVNREPIATMDSNLNRDSEYYTYPNNQFYHSYNRIPQTSLSNNNAVRYDNVLNKYVNINQNSNSYVSNTNRPIINQNQGITTVYVVRGNGDPNNPEIVNLRPGERLT